MPKTEESKPLATPRLLNVREVSQKLGLSEKQIRREVASKRLPHIRIGRLIRVQPDDLEAFIAMRRKARRL